MSSLILGVLPSSDGGVEVSNSLEAKDVALISYRWGKGSLPFALRIFTPAASLVGGGRLSALVGTGYG